MQKESLFLLLSLVALSAAEKGPLFGFARDNAKSGGRNKQTTGIASAVEDSSVPVPYRSFDNDNTQSNSRDEIVSSAIDMVSNVSGALIYLYLAKHMVKALSETVRNLMSMNSTSTEVSPSDEHAAVFQRQNVTLNSFEREVFASSVTDPLSIETDFQSLGGMREIKSSLLDCVDTILYEEDHERDTKTASSLMQPTQGILLYGPPGCGKTALARSLSKRTSLPMIQISPSSLLRKWVGETSQLSKACFSLARKLEPCILFVDEMDGLFRYVGGGVHAFCRFISYLGQSGDINKSSKTYLTRIVCSSVFESHRLISNPTQRTHKLPIKHQTPILYSITDLGISMIMPSTGK